MRYFATANNSTWDWSFWYSAKPHRKRKRGCDGPSVDARCPRSCKHQAEGCPGILPSSRRRPVAIWKREGTQFVSCSARKTGLSCLDECHYSWARAFIFHMESSQPILSVRTKPLCGSISGSTGPAPRSRATPTDPIWPKPSTAGSTMRAWRESWRCSDPVPVSSVPVTLPLAGHRNSHSLAHRPLVPAKTPRVAVHLDAQNRYRVTAE